MGRRRNKIPDITICRNERCPRKMECYRYRAEPDPYWQSYADFGDGKNCRYFVLYRDKEKKDKMKNV